MRRLKRTGRVSGDNEGKDWRDVSTLRSTKDHWQPPEARPCSEGAQPADTWIRLPASDPWEHKFPLFKATHFAMCYWGGPGKLMRVFKFLNINPILSWSPHLHAKAPASSSWKFNFWNVYALASKTKQSWSYELNLISCCIIYILRRTIFFVHVETWRER